MFFQHGHVVERSAIYETVAEIAEMCPSWDIDQDTLTFKIMDVWVDLKCSTSPRSIDTTCFGSDCIQSILASAPQSFGDIILAFKLILYHHACIRHRQNSLLDGLPSAFTMTCWAIAILKAFQCPYLWKRASGSVAISYDILYRLLHAFVDFKWSERAILLTAAGNFSVTSRHCDKAPIQVMMEVQDVNSADGVQADTMTRCQERVKELLRGRKALPQLLWEALEAQGLEDKLSHLQHYAVLARGPQVDSAWVWRLLGLELASAGVSSGRTDAENKQVSATSPPRMHAPQSETSRTHKKARLTEDQQLLEWDSLNALSPGLVAPHAAAAEEVGANSMGAPPQTGRRRIAPPPGLECVRVPTAPASSPRSAQQQNVTIKLRCKAGHALKAPDIQRGQWVSCNPSLTSWLESGGVPFTPGLYHIENWTDQATVQVVVHPSAIGNRCAPIIVLVPGADGFWATADTSAQACIEVRIHFGGKSRKQAANASDWDGEAAKLVRETLATVRRWADVGNGSTTPLQERRHVGVVAFGRGACWLLKILASVARFVDFVWILAGHIFVCILIFHMLFLESEEIGSAFPPPFAVIGGVEMSEASRCRRLRDLNVDGRGREPPMLVGAANAVCGTRAFRVLRTLNTEYSECGTRWFRKSGLCSRTPKAGKRVVIANRFAERVSPSEHGFRHPSFLRNAMSPQT